MNGDNFSRVCVMGQGRVWAACGKCTGVACEMPGGCSKLHRGTCGAARGGGGVLAALPVNVRTVRPFCAVLLGRCVLGRTGSPTNLVQNKRVRNREGVEQNR